MSQERALLFIDVVDSTRLSESLGDAAMARLWAEHDRAARGLLGRWRGREIDKADGMLVLFDSAADAVGYVCGYHDALDGLSVPLAARAGLHVGPVAIRATGEADIARGAKPLELDGLAKPTAARVMALAAGGQTLLSADALRSLGAAPPRVQSHGHWKMKGLLEPIEIFELAAADRPFAPPQDGDKAYRVVRRDDRWLPAREIANNLPHPTTRFVGRARELDALQALLAGARLLTLTGSGGCGKTRIGLRLAAESMHRFVDGVWCVELAALGDPALVPRTVAAALGLKEEAGTASDDAVAAHLRGKRSLLLLDNCEHLLDACAGLAESLLRGCPGLTILASSREPLAVDGEQVYRVPSLSLPDARQAATPESIGRFEAVQLFVDRATRARPEFELTDANAATLASICTRLDGIPLALELAAARVRSLSIEQIHQNLDRRFQLLTGGSRTALPRQQTLRSLIDWSYDLLNERERAALRALSVFAGGWTLDAAAQVFAGRVEGDAEAEAITLLSALVDKSLVAAEPGDERFRMLETVRQYARERLLESSAADAARDRHRDHFVAFAEAMAAAMGGEGRAAALRRTGAEHENLRAALEWSSLGDAPLAGLRLCGALSIYWASSGHFSEGRGWCARMLSLPGNEGRTLERAKALAVAASLAYYQGNLALARSQHEAALEIRRELGDRSSITLSLSGLAAVVIEQGDHAYAGALLDECLALARGAGDEQRVAFALLNLGVMAHTRSDFAAARELYAEAVGIQRREGQRRNLAQSLNNLGNIAFEQRDFAGARGHLEESLGITKELADRVGMATNFHNLGKVAHAEGDLPAAAAWHDESFAIFREIGDRKGIAYWLEEMAAWLAALGRPGAAAQAFGGAARLREDMGSPLPANEHARHAGFAEAARRALGGDAFDEAWRRGRGATLEETLSFVLAERRGAQ